MSSEDVQILILCWVFANIILALLPMIASLIVVLMHYDIRTKWLDILKAGELFLFSTTLATASIAKILMPIPGEKDPVTGKIPLIMPAIVPASVPNLLGLLVVLILATILFGIATDQKLKTNVGEASQAGELAVRRYVVGSIACTLIAVLLSYNVFIHGGMR